MLDLEKEYKVILFKGDEYAVSKTLRLYVRDYVWQGEDRSNPFKAQLLKGGSNEKELELKSLDPKCPAVKMTFNYKVKTPIDALTKILIQSSIKFNSPMPKSQQKILFQTDKGSISAAVANFEGTMNGRQKSGFFNSREVGYSSKVYTQFYSGTLKGEYKLNADGTKWDYIYDKVTEADIGYDWSERDIFTTKNSTWAFQADR